MIANDDIDSRINEKYPNFEYVSGYNNCESTIKIRCKICGNIFERCASILRRHRTLRCKGCNELKQEEAELNKKKHKEFKRMSKLKLTENNKEEHAKSHTMVCIECNKEFKGKTTRSRFCSAECRNRRSNKIREINRRHKLKSNGKIEWDISLNKLISRDKNKCKICGKGINLKDYQVNKNGTFIAGNNYPSIDHIKPVSKGGTHTWNNVQLAHRGCNSIKTNKNVYETTEGQLRFSL